MYIKESYIPMDLTREKEAINAYLKLLQVKGAKSVLLRERSSFLEKLIVYLLNKQLVGNEYREAVEDLMDTIPADDWHASLTAAREFYPFWKMDMKLIAAINVNAGFDVSPAQWTPLPASLKSLINSLETEKFDASESWPLKAYSQALRHEGAEKVLVETRVKLAKILLIRLKNAPSRDHKTYRTATDQTLPLFNIKESRYLFLVVVREFYNFWIGNPEASSMVFKEDSPRNILM